MPDMDENQILRIVRRYLDQHPVTDHATLNVDTLVVKDSLTVSDLVAFTQSASWRNIGSQGQPTFQNSWVAFGAPNASPGFMKLPDGFVQLQGAIKTGTLGSSAFTLPPGFRPVSSVSFIVLSNGAAGRVDVATTGTVTPASPSTNTSVALDQIRFKAA